MLIHFTYSNHHYYEQSTPNVTCDGWLTPADVKKEAVQLNVAVQWPASLKNWPFRLFDLWLINDILRQL